MSDFILVTWALTSRSPVLKESGSFSFAIVMPFSFISGGMILVPTVAAVASFASKMIATDLISNVFLK